MIQARQSEAAGPASPMPRGLRRWLPVMVIVLAGAATYARALGGGFVWDDQALIVNNTHLPHIGWAFTHSYWDFGQGQRKIEHEFAHLYYRPLVMASFAIDHAIWGMSPLGFHLTNIVLHLVVMLLAYAVALRLDLSPTEALISALVFGLHPTRAEAVCWVSGRTDVMMGAFFLAALLFFWRWLASQRARWGDYLAGWICTVAAVACKESAVALAVVIPLLDRWVVPSSASRFRANAWRLHLPLVSIVAIFVVWRMVLDAGLWAGREVYGVADRLNLFLSSVAHYASMIIDPYQPDAMIDPYFNARVLNWAGIAGGSVFVLVLVAALIWLARRQPRGAWALALFIAALLPASNVVPLRLTMLAAERFIYLPFLGVALLLGIGLHRASRRLRRIAIVAIVLLLPTFSLTIATRAADYDSARRFWGTMVLFSPGNPLAQQELGGELVKARRYRAGERHLIAAFRGWVRAGKQDKLLESQLRIVDVDLLRTPDLRVAQLRRVAVFLRQLEASASGRLERRLAVKLRELELQVVLREPRDRKALVGLLPTVQSLAGSVLSRLGDDAAAIRAFERSIKRAPERRETKVNMALALARAFRFERAEAIIEQLASAGPLPPPLVKLRRSFRAARRRVAALRLRGLTLSPPGVKTKRSFSLTRVAEQDPTVHRVLAEIFVLLKAPLRVQQHLWRAIELAPGRRSLRAMLALELASSGDRRGALAVIARARRHFGAQPGLERLVAQVESVYLRRWLSGR